MIIHGFAANDPHPARTGASQRLFGLYRGLAERHTTHLLAVVPNRHPGPADEQLGRLHIVRAKAWHTALAWRLEQAHLAPMFLAAHVFRLGARRMRERLPGTPDVRIADIGVAGVLEGPRGALRVYQAQNVEADHFVSAGPRLLARGRWARGMRALEARACAHSDLVVVTCDADAERMAELYALPAERLAIVPNGYDELAVRSASTRERDAARRALGIVGDDLVALFLGSDVPHNRAALARVMDEVMPATRGVRLLVVGSVSRSIVARREPWLTVRPEVDELLPLLHACDVGLNPVVGGSGSNVKVPTYLAAGLAVLTTEHGLRGYADLAGWVVSAELAAFASALGAAPRGWAARGEPKPPPLERYAWGALGAELGIMLERAMQAAPISRDRAATRHAPGAGARAETHPALASPASPAPPRAPAGDRSNAGGAPA